MGFFSHFSSNLKHPYRTRHPVVLPSISRLHCVEDGYCCGQQAVVSLLFAPGQYPATSNLKFIRKRYALSTCFQYLTNKIHFTRLTMHSVCHSALHVQRAPHQLRPMENPRVGQNPAASKQLEGTWRWAS